MTTTRGQTQRSGGAKDRIRGRPVLADLYLVGLGMRGVSQVTREVEDVLRRCTRIFAGVPLQAMARFLSTLPAPVVDLQRFYVKGKARLMAYEAMAEAVLAGAQAAPPVAYVTYGHPLVGTTPSQILLERGPKLGLKVATLPGISSIDCLLAELGVDPLDSGLQVYEATDLLLRRRPLQADVPCFILQPGAVESELHCDAPSRARRFRRLRSYLLRFYPPHHKIFVASCGMGPGRPAELRRITVARLEHGHRSLRGPATLFVPPARVRPVRDRALERLLFSAQHARAITSQARDAATDNDGS